MAERQAKAPTRRATLLSKTVRDHEKEQRRARKVTRCRRGLRGTVLLEGLVAFGHELLDLVRRTPALCDGVRYLRSFFGEINQMLDFGDVFFRRP